MARVTLRQVAAAAHVSVATASVALRGAAGVSEQTRARVVETAARMGYHPHAGARSLRGGYRPVVGVLLDPLLLEGDLDSDAQFVRRFVTGLGRQAAAQAASMVLLDPGGDATVVDVVVWVRLGDDEVPAVRMADGTPVVFAGAGEIPARAGAVLRFDAVAMTSAVMAALTGQGAVRPALVRVRSRAAHLAAFEAAYRAWCERVGVVAGVWSYAPDDDTARAVGPAVVAAGYDAVFVCTGRLRDVVLAGLREADQARDRRTRVAIVAARRPPGAPDVPITLLHLQADACAQLVVTAAVEAASGNGSIDRDLPWSVDVD